MGQDTAGGVRYVPIGQVFVAFVHQTQGFGYECEIVTGHGILHAHRDALGKQASTLYECIAEALGRVCDLLVEDGRLAVNNDRSDNRDGDECCGRPGYNQLEV